MIAGTLARLVSPAEGRLETTFRDGGRLPGLDVRTTQTSFDDRPIQTGMAAARLPVTETDVSVARDRDGQSQAIMTERVEGRESFVTDWTADVTSSGLIAVESAAGDGDLDFPFDIFYASTDRRVERLAVDVSGLHKAWADEDVLGDVWMVGAEDSQGASIDYHARASAADRPTIGLGFQRPWNATVVEGVVYRSGYVALYSVERANDFVRFVDGELGPFLFVPDDDDGGGQATLDESGGGR